QRSVGFGSDGLLHGGDNPGGARLRPRMGADPHSPETSDCQGIAFCGDGVCGVEGTCGPWGTRGTWETERQSRPPKATRGKPNVELPNVLPFRRSSRSARSYDVSLVCPTTARMSSTCAAAIRKAPSRASGSFSRTTYSDATRTAPPAAASPGS